MKKQYCTYCLLLTIIFTGLVLMITGCKKNAQTTLAILTTNNLSNVTSTTATSGGAISSDGGGQVYSRGVCWSTTSNPTISLLTKTTDGAGTGNFSSSIIGLYGGATFYIRAYATNDAGTAYGNEVALTIPITIGQGLGGGMVFYLDGTGLHGLIASYFDESVSTWYNGSNIVTNATSITDGSLNTTTIISAQGNTGVYAAKLCKDYRLGGYSDWFLPSKDQLNKLYLQKSLLGNLVNNIYWSSTEIDNTQVWGQNFLNGTQAAASKNAMSYVRPIRSF